MAISKICSIPDCGKRAHARGWCSIHYFRWRKHGGPLAGGKVRPPRGSVPIYLQEVAMQYEGDECLIWPFCRNAKGYAVMNSSGSALVNRLICEAVHGKPPQPKMEAAHSCGKGHEACVTKGHLLWKTPKENQADRRIHGTHQQGERHPVAKLKDREVVEILSLRKQGMGPVEIAKLFGVSSPNITAICKNRSWKWIPR